MNSFVVQSRLLGTRPVVLNTLNLAKPADGPTLLTVTEVTTLFHEFGHALHGLLSDVAYPTFAGTGVPRDFVEFPSQVNEVWLRDPEIVARYARHHVTGEPLPADLAARLTDTAPAFGEGWATTEYLAAALLDLAWHRLAPGRGGRRRGGVRGRRAGRRGRRGPDGTPALPQRVLQPRLRRGVLRGLLLLHLERGPRRRHRGVVRRARRPAAGATARRSVGSCSPAAAAWTRWRPTARSAAATREIAPLLARRGLTG